MFERDSAWPLGFAPPDIIQGNPETPIEPTDVPVANVPILAAATPSAPVATHASGFAHLELFAAFYDGGSYDLTFRPRELELNLETRYGDVARLRTDVNLILDDILTTFATNGFDRLLVNDLIEQAYLEYKACCVTTRLGVMDAPVGVEALDPTDRIALSRSPLAVLTTLTLATGLWLSTSLLEELDLQAMAFNGWAPGIDGNDQKSVLLGLPHRLSIYRGTFTGIVGAERANTNDLRWLINYDANVRALPWLNVLLEMAYGQEEGLGRRKKTGLPDGTKTATWYGGHLEAQYVGDALPIQGALRFVYLHDPDLVIGLPSYPNLGSLTTLLSTTAAARYPLTRGIEAVAEYRTDFERGDVANVSIQRNYDAFPEFWNVTRWFVTHTATVGVLARY